jgi:hypothetical protein
MRLLITECPQWSQGERAFSESRQAKCQAVKPAPERRVSTGRRLLHDNETGAVQVLNDPLRGDRGHVFIGLMHALPVAIAQRKGDCLGEALSLLLSWRGVFALQLGNRVLKRL